MWMQGALSTNRFCFVGWVVLIFPLELTLLRGMCSVSWFVSETVNSAVVLAVHRVCAILRSP